MYDELIPVEIVAELVGMAARRHGEVFPCVRCGRVLDWPECITREYNGVLYIWYNTSDHSTHALPYTAEYAK